ncbi:D-alanyl-D-alanine carboxypeptidase family protein [Ruminiclostridium cellulolyticum]|uniref:serine-type D-Ala-D-Ala carboxypeptidase n=1 Tax=Ruminiclostridium cellulolyticum (strain ATCC 35319 / DSM 5812 / JCM 6584 / H10) TaxID=394503 RepID=B8I6L0_RUMCH|nr:D-alanyl-D-alanine carboxypeptidase family protein [Ruminiclostridium cellulolyticum]ACL74902.1 peptidase S11 D-alanyl-D-alanine carboxypeptidase 1 [Ruminiclostridium cellulolyticum H10]
MSKKILIVFVALILIFNCLPVFAWTPTEGLTSSSVVLMDTVRGQILFEKNAYAHLSPSVMCKLMTALVTIEKTDLNAKVTISKNAASFKGLNLVVGNQYTVEDLLYAVMLSQGNDAAVALAEYVGDGDIQKFVRYMNTKAKELSLKDTYFVNPTGLYEKDQYTSAKDIAVLVKAAISNNTFNLMFGARGFGWLNGNNSSILTNQNTLFWSYKGVDGGKIGTNTNPQSISAVTTATLNEKRLIAVVFNTNEENAFSETAKLFDYGFSKFYTGVLVPKNIPQRSIEVDNVKVDLVSKIDVYYTYPVGDSFINNISFTPNEKLKLPLNTETIAGVLKYTLNDNTVIEVNLYSDKTVSAPEDYISKIKNIVTENRDLVIIVGILAIIELVLIAKNLLKFIFKAKKTRTQK